MNRTPLHLIVNPTAGRGRAGKRLARIQALLADAGIQPRLHASKQPGELENIAYALAREENSSLIVVGGDGSVHEVVNGLLRAGGRSAFGLIPSGTGNDFAKAADIPLDWRTAAMLLAERIQSGATPRLLDAGRVNARYFANGAGIGLDAEVTETANHYRWPIGPLVYLLAIIRVLAGHYQTPRVRINIGDLIWDGPLTLAAISNGPYVGGLFHIAPLARPDDALLELMVAPPLNRWQILRLLPRLMNGTHVGKPGIAHFRFAHARIESESAVASHLDGELQPRQTSFDIELLPAALRLL